MSMGSKTAMDPAYFHSMDKKNRYVSQLSSVEHQILCVFHYLIQVRNDKSVSKLYFT